MSVDTGDREQDDGEQHRNPDVKDAKVKDKEGLVDKKTKDQILTLRKQVDNDERELFVNRRSDPDIQLQYYEAVQYWGISVRQYLRGIKRLWGADPEKYQVQNVNEYWREIDLGSETLIPPDKDGYQFSLIAHDEIGAERLRHQLGLPAKAEIPKPKTRHVHGLSDVLNRNRFEANWIVTIDDAGAPPEHETIVLQQATPMPKHILESAVESADNFLQQAGLGMNVGNELPTDGI